MSKELCDEFLDDMDYNFNKVKCRKIDGLMKMVELLRWIHGKTEIRN